MQELAATHSYAASGKGQTDRQSGSLSSCGFCHTGYAQVGYIIAKYPRAGIIFEPDGQIDVTICLLISYMGILHLNSPVK